MPDLEYFVVCESVAIDRESNRISMFHVIEDVNLHRVIEGEEVPVGLVPH